MDLAITAVLGLVYWAFRAVQGALAWTTRRSLVTFGLAFSDARMLVLFNVVVDLVK